MNQQKGHPIGLYLLFFTEMWERFSYYGMRAILILFLTKQLLFDKAFASDQLYGSFTGLVYLTPLLGGYMADRYWGNRKSIIIGGLLMALGQFMLFFSGHFTSHFMMYAGLGVLVFGNGFFKPNISTMVGSLYPENDHRIDSAYTIFYMGINVGAFIAPIVCGYLGEEIAFKWGFMAAGVGMILGTLTFYLLKNKYLITPEGAQIGEQPNKANLKIGESTIAAKFDNIQMGLITLGSLAFICAFHFIVGFDWVGSVIFGCAISIPATIITDKSLNSIEKDRIWVIFCSAFFVIFFWAAFEQAGASLTYFADEQTDRSLFGFVIPAAAFQSVNAAFVVIFAPVLSWLWLKLHDKGMEPPSLKKQAIGLLLLALGYLWISFGVNGLHEGVKVSMIWLIVLYLLHTFGELCLSPIGLSMVNKLAPARFASLLMGVWFLANATANKFAGMLSALYPEAGKPAKHFLGFEIANLYHFFMLFVVLAGIASGILFLLNKPFKKLMHGIK